MEGFVELRTEAIWRRLWLVLSQYTLSCYNKKEDDEAWRSFDILKITLLEEPSSPTYRKFCFEIVGTDGKLHLFSVKNERIKRNWVRMIERHQQGDFEVIERRRSSSFSVRYDPALVNPFAKYFVPPGEEFGIEDEDIYNALTKGPLSTSQPVLPLTKSESLEKALSTLNNPNKKRHSIHRAFNSLRLKKNPKGEQIQSLSDQVIQKWKRSPDQLAVWIDFPRLAKNILILDENLLPLNTKPSDEVRSDGNQMREEMRKLLCILALKLDEKETAVAVDQHFLDNIEMEPSAHLQQFFSSYISPTSKLIGILKVLNQVALAAPYLSLKDHFNAVDLPFKDSSGEWDINVLFRQDEVVVVHSKGAKSVSDQPKEHFTFTWTLTIVFDQFISKITKVKIQLDELETSKQMEFKKRKKLQNLVAHEILV